MSFIFRIFVLNKYTMNDHKILQHPKTGIRYLDTHTAVRGSDSSIARSEDNDCVVRAFAAITEVDYDIAHDYIRRIFKRIKGKGTPRFGPIMEQRAGLCTCGKMKYERMTNHTETTYTKKSKLFNWHTNEYEVTEGEVTINSRHWPLITTYGKTSIQKIQIKYRSEHWLVFLRSNPLLKSRIPGSNRAYQKIIKKILEIS